MTRHRGSKEAVVAKKRPGKRFSFISLGSKTKGWDKNPPARDCPYFVFGKRLQRSLMGFGSLMTAIYSQEMITEATLNAMHGTLDPGKSNMRYFHERLGFHRATAALLRHFPDIKKDIAQAGQNDKPLIEKIRKVTKGAFAARNTDANSIRTGIFTLSHADAEKRGWSMPAMIEKSNCGIKSQCTALFLLPFQERNKYLEDPAAYREKVERNQIKLSLTDTWPAILYDESMLDDDDELAGLFRSETLLRCGITILCSPSAGRAWKYAEPGARSFSASQKESNAEINGIRRITPEAVAYFSTLVIFAVHDGENYVRDLGDIDLSEVYHDVVAALRTKTEWAVETLAFWNQIFFGESEEEEPTPRTNREDRFKRLEAKQREKEGLTAVSAGLPRLHARPLQSAQDPGDLRPGSLPLDDLDDEDQTTTSKSTASGSRSQLQSNAPPPPKSKAGQKRKKNIPDSDADADQDSEPDVDADQDPELESESDSGEKETDTAIPPPKRTRRQSADRERPPATSRPTTSKEKQTTRPSPSQPQGGTEDADRVSVDKWETICEGFKRSAEHATTIGRKEATEEFEHMVSMRPTKGAQWLAMDVERQYKRTIATGLKLKIPAAKKKAPSKRRKGMVVYFKQSHKQVSRPHNHEGSPGVSPANPAKKARRVTKTTLSLTLKNSLPDMSHLQAGDVGRQNLKLSH
ncbi:hypothetical protein BJ322DRAFT_1188188 [Thelephora terrestris]|uniref:Uncharacterized protein n=1 Tax=Thelephora terrestris TaxID=56493 RepID=A0A9P6HHQ5_9AGAM|nr:hypothetical protein BJ322DRAFT_1188188 [Thelephora terrestris]